MTPLIAIRNLYFAWPGQPALLNIGELTLAPGERLFIKGPSGSGKSTLLGLLAGIHAAPRGSLHILEQDLGALSAHKRDRFRADHLGYIFQQFNLLPFLSVVENVTAALTFSRYKRRRLTAPAEQEAKRLLAALQLPDALWQQPVHQLSIGQQQRVAAARALIGRPELVIADEPTSALDADSRAAFMALLFAECDHQGSGLVFVSHDTGLEPLFSRVESLKALNGATSC
ncbi:MULTISPECIES: ABC transporter ATP-binding protein [Oceanimonas]|uniref:Methionine ABC transporter ATP-binding protein n=1 Tax=Oceanimonas doudoroffii TaxID=84158 RepID=A0A233RGA8_9GAMM|nr:MULTISPECIES: ABC transporter ATP-binding protein [Oceanimonas]NHI01971.1 Cell division ATP-binding protein FtsE [Oceanimonas sp. MB9]OXY82430.1 methionine ABC transporter ATP-binding protein [Oceanimonas doudoroffii]